MTSKTITSAANPVVKQIKSLSQKKYRDEEGLFVVEGIRHVQDGIEGGLHLQTLAFSPRAADDALGKIIIAGAKAEKLDVTDDLLSRMTGRENAQSMIGVFRTRDFSLSDVMDGLWVALEDIRDPGNLGTIARTADAAGAAGVILIGQTCDPWSPEAVRATMGSFARMKFISATPAAFANWRPSFKGRVIGTHLKASEDYRKINYTSPLILLMGNEQKGLSDAMTDLCDARVRIPMAATVESLNLAVATGVMLYEAQRHQL